MLRSETDLFVPPQAGTLEYSSDSRETLRRIQCGDGALSTSLYLKQWHCFGAAHAVSQTRVKSTQLHR